MKKPSHKSVKSSRVHSAAEIAARAYQIYEREGRPEGRDHQHWVDAEAQLLEELAMPAGSSGGVTR